MIEVEVEGTIFEFPNGTPDAVISKTIKDSFAEEPPKLEARPLGMRIKEAIGRQRGMGRMAGGLFGGGLGLSSFGPVGGAGGATMGGAGGEAIEQSLFRMFNIPTEQPLPSTPQDVMKSINRAASQEALAEVTGQSAFPITKTIGGPFARSMTPQQTRLMQYAQKEGLPLPASAIRPTKTARAFEWTGDLLVPGQLAGNIQRRKLSRQLERVYNELPAQLRYRVDRDTAGELFADAIKTEKKELRARVRTAYKAWAENAKQVTKKGAGRQETDFTGQALEDMIEEVKSGEPGRFYTLNEGAGWERRGYKSGYPDWFRDLTREIKGLDKKQWLQAIEKGQAGEKLGIRQDDIYLRTLKIARDKGVVDYSWMVDELQEAMKDVGGYAIGESRIPMRETAGVLNKYKGEFKSGTDTYNYFSMMADQANRGGLTIDQIDGLQSQIWELTYRKKPYVGGKLWDAIETDLITENPRLWAGLQTAKDLAKLHKAFNKNPVVRIVGKDIAKGNPNDVILHAFRPGNMKMLAPLKKVLPKDIWNTAVDRFVKNIIDTGIDPTTGNFAPARFLNNYEKYKPQLHWAAPEIAENMDNFANAFRVAMPELAKMKPGLIEQTAKSGLTGLMGFGAYKHPVIAVPAGFSTYIAYSIRNPRGLMKRWLTEGIAKGEGTKQLLRFGARPVFQEQE